MVSGAEGTRGALSRTLKADFEKRWGDDEFEVYTGTVRRGVKNRQKGVHPAFVIATFLHPQFKLLEGMNLNETSKRKVYDDVLDLMVKSFDSEEIDDRKGDRTNDPEPEGTDQTDSVGNFFENIICANLVDINEEPENEVRRKCKEELNRYKDETVRKTKTKFDVLLWWKRNESEFPHLAQIAKKYLSIQATSAPSERIFSKAGQIIDAQRTSLDSDMCGKLLYVSMNYNWYKKNALLENES